ncbi:hypothetical protein P692DRAFT_20156456 [Suillus brevipes Sb2]|nr:hypothetical protein P692DRAFT_20156456 [Suillus brevipes Sb2]
MRMGVGKAKNVLSTCESQPFDALGNAIAFSHRARFCISLDHDDGLSFISPHSPSCPTCRPHLSIPAPGLPPVIALLPTPIGDLLLSHTSVRGEPLGTLPPSKNLMMHP